MSPELDQASKNLPQKSTNRHSKAIQQNTLLRLSADLSSKLSQQEVCQTLVKGLQETLGYDVVGVYLLDKETGNRVYVTTVGYKDSPKVMKPGEGISELAIIEGKLIYTADVSQLDRYCPGVWGSEVDIPLIAGDEIFGVLIVERSELNAFDQRDFEVLTAAAQQAGIAFDNARLFQQAQQEIVERKKAEEQLQEYQGRLQELVDERTVELRQSEQRYRSLFDGIPVGVYRSTPAGQIVDANLALVQMMGFTDRERYLALNPVDVYVDPEDRVRWQVLMEKEGIVRDFEERLRRCDDTVIWASDTARAVKDKSGKVQYYEGVVEDITERKRTEEELRKYREQLEELVEERTAELRESEERYRTLFDGVPVGLYRATPEGQLLDANLAFVKMLGYQTREELLNIYSTAIHYIDPYERERWKELLDREGVVRDFEIYGQTLNGEVGWYSDSSHVVKDKIGNPLYYEGRVENITQRKLIEEEILHQKEYFEALFLNSPTAIASVDLEAKVVAWNPMAEKLFGYSRDEAIGTDIDDLVAKGTSFIEEARNFTQLALAKESVQAATKRSHKDGTLIDIELRSLPVIVAGETVGFIVMYHDIRQIQEARRAAEAANKAKSTFLANMSHELRTPLNAILGFSQLMNSYPNLTTEQQEYLGIINRSGEHLLALINDVLEMSKIEAGRITINESSFDLHNLLITLQEMFEFRTKEKGINFYVEQADNVPRYIRTDESKLRQVLNNLIGNAVKFTVAGSVFLRISAQVESPGQCTLNFVVEDTGPGISADEIEAVFDPFVQASTAASVMEGSGLGLSISRQYVRQMGGDLILESQVGVGSIFRFHIQVALADEAAIDQDLSIQKNVRLASDQFAPDGRPFRMLVAEDVESNRQLLFKLLQSIGFEVHAVENGEQALQIWQNWQPHVIWMDMRMPVMDGYEATRRIKCSPKGIETIIIALTASAFEEDRERILAEGCDDFLRKPFREGEIHQLLVKHLHVRFIDQRELVQEQFSPMATSIPSLRKMLIDLDSLPDKWQDNLKKAALKADLNLILELADQITAQSPELASRIRTLAQNFEYAEILDFIEMEGTSDE